MVDVLPIFIRWVGGAILLYPWMYSVLDTIFCAPNGILDDTTMTCICPAHKSGLHCDDCLVPKTHGSCEGSRSVCTGLRRGTICQTCMGVIAGDTCGDICDNNRGYYSYRDTCRYCDREETCAGNGRCLEDGLCQCDNGWAAQIDGSEPCSLPCPADSDSIPCSGHGVCVAGGRCQCTAPYCGELCDIPLVHQEDLLVPNISWCYGNGIPDIEIGNTCTCNCKHDQYGQPMTIPSDLHSNNFCKYLCPVGSGGHVCGNSPISYPVLVTGSGIAQCGCQCSATGHPRLVACDTDCAYGGLQKVDGGDCDCVFPNQVGTYPSFCRTCKPGYFMPEFGCQAYCSDSTCITGYCDVDTQNSLRMTCRGCGNNRDGEIIQVEMQSNVIVGTTDKHGAFSNVTYGNFLSSTETRQATIAPASSGISISRYFVFSETEVIVHLNSTENATVTIEETDSTLGDAPYRLAQPQAYEMSGTYYGKPMAVSIADDTDIASLCILRAPLCQGYTLSVPAMYRQISNDDVSGDIIESDDVFIVATAANFLPQQPYQITIVDTVARGCATCTANYYPEPVDNLFGDESCRTYCTNGTCHYNGHCSGEGTCICNHANMDAVCAKCQPNFYPEPGFDVTNPCSQSCFSDKMPDDRGTGNVLLNASTCSNHGVCNATGQCRCSDTLKGPLNGFLGESCEHACNPTHNSSVVCSGHGVCIDGRCAQCDDGYFGTQCEVTCSRSDQYFWKEYLAGEIVTPDTETNVPCSREGNSLLCLKIPCNGGTCAPTHQYTHLDNTMSYKLCDNAVGDDNRYPLIECTGYDTDTYPYNASTGKDRIAQDLGIYCSVDNSASASELTSRMGLCTRAECQCSKTATRISRNGVVRSSLSTRLAGPACQNSGCSISGFGNIARWASACGEHPPPSIANPLQVLYQNPDNLEIGLSNLHALIAAAPQMCSHGTCRTIISVANGTEFSAAPATSEGVAGYCECKQTPEVSSVRSIPHRTLQGELTTRTVQCSAQDDPLWAQACCNAYIENGKSPYFGQGCADRCLCNDAQYWKGTCAIGNTGDVVGVGCNCRAGFHSDLNAGPQTRLFCGPTCDYMCKGVINRLTKAPISNVRSACPAEYVHPTSPARQQGCYDDLVPCSGHGVCAGRNGMCLHTTSLYTGKESRCMCWGSSIQLSDVPDNYELPATVSLYGGDDCSTPCPGAELLDKFMEENYDTLYNANEASTDEILNTKRQFIHLYAQHICSGHGYCSSTATIKNSRLRCECPGDWGGDRCDKQCKLDNTYWGSRRPFQERYENQEVDNRLAMDFGLNVCGPRGRCAGETSNECTLSPMYSGGNFVGRTYDDAFIYAKSLVVADDTLFADFFEQWSMAFVGAFSICHDAYYSARPLSRSAQESSYIHQVPDVVGWQLTRSCDARYLQLVSHPNDANAPWCCQEPLAGGEWKDEKFVALGTHGGCPVNQCPNFATGRQCTECRSSAFAHLLNDADAPCNTVDALDQPFGYCTVCAQKPYQNMVHPYDIYPGAGQRYGESELECEQCISNKYRLSGEQKYKITQLNTQICNGHGRCMGRSKTFGGKLYGQIASDFVVDKDSDELVCGEHPKLGLCECDPGFEGPTCAMPTTDDACGEHGTLKNFITSYSYCECDPGYIGMYCDSHDNTGVSSQTKFISMCQVVQWVSDDAPQVIDCNDPTGNTPCRNGKCETCAHPLLDPDAMCREYKADIVEAHQEMVKKKRVGITCST